MYECTELIDLHKQSNAQSERSNGKGEKMSSQSHTIIFWINIPIGDNGIGTQHTPVILKIVVCMLFALGAYYYCATAVMGVAGDELLYW